MARTTPSMRNISTTFEEKYQTHDGNVTVTNFKRGLWQVMPRGKAPFMVGSKREAFDQAIGIASRHWGLPKKVAFPTRTSPHHSSMAKRKTGKGGKWEVEAGRGLTYDRGDGRGALLMFNLHRAVDPITSGSNISPVELDEITRSIAAFLNRSKRKLKPSPGSRSRSR